MMLRDVIWLKRRKGLDKPIFLVATIALALMFIAIYYAAVSGWLDSSMSEFTSIIERKQEAVQ